MKKLHALALALAAFFLTQCNSTEVHGVAPGTKITKLYIVKNPDLHMAGMQPEVVKQVQQLGIATELVDAPPPGNVYHMTFTANWAWDMAMYLRTFRAELYEGNVSKGKVIYETKGTDMAKFGHTDAKIRPLLRELLTGQKTIHPKKKPTSQIAR